MGFATVALNAFHERMGVVDMIAVDPEYQRRGIARLLMDRTIDHMRAHGNGHRGSRNRRRRRSCAGARPVRGPRLYGATKRQIPQAARLIAPPDLGHSGQRLGRTP